MNYYRHDPKGTTPTSIKSWISYTYNLDNLIIKAQFKGALDVSVYFCFLAFRLHGLVAVSCLVVVFFVAVLMNVADSFLVSFVCNSLFFLFAVRFVL